VYRIIDFTLSNCVNSNLRRIFILTQYKALELTRHIREGWNIFSGELNEFIEVIPPMKRIHEDWYLGTADAVYQNIESIITEDPEYTLILSGDHIYKMDYNEMISWHQQKQADVSIATIQIVPEEAKRFGVVEVDSSYRVVGFEEKPQHGNPIRSIFNPNMVSASMGIYVFNTRHLKQALIEDAANPDSSHDFGKDILPRWIGRSNVIAYDFRDLNRKVVRYWRDVGTLDAYYEANMDLIEVTPEFNLYDKQWPLRTRLVQQPPAKFVFAHEGRRMGVAMDSIVSAGCIISGGRVNRSVLSPGVSINSYCEIDSSILMAGVEVGRYSRIRRTIVGPNVVLPESSVIGYNLEEDRAKGYMITDSGVVVAPGRADPVV
jgi:glucose-1-phosphate adenylyltransferase